MAVLFGALILVGFAKLLPGTGLGQWSEGHIIVLYLITLGAVCYLPTRHIIEATENHIVNRRKQNDIRKQLESLGTDDRFLLHNPISNQAMSFNVGSLNYHIAKSLGKRGILSEVECRGNGGGFAIAQQAYDYLVQHPELVGVKKAK